VRGYATRITNCTASSRGVNVGACIREFASPCGFVVVVVVVVVPVPVVVVPFVLDDEGVVDSIREEVCVDARGESKSGVA